MITDHKPLEHVNIRAHTDEELGDLAHELLQFDFDVIYRPESCNFEADCLSRNPVLPPSSDLVPETPILRSFNFLSLNNICKLQESISITSSDTIKSGVILRKFATHSLIVLDDISGENLARIVHVTFRLYWLKSLYNILCKYFCFSCIYSICRKVCRNCKVCIANKTLRIRRSGLLGFFGPASQPFQIMSFDTIGGFEGMVLINVIYIF